MKIYILSNEDSTQDQTFFSPLTSVGLDNANKLIKKLENLNITHIFSSPNVRTLQTITPFAKGKNIKIKLEYGLSNIQTSDIIPKKSYQVRLPEYMAELFNYEPNYKEIIKAEELEYDESDKILSIRIKKVLSSIISLYAKVDSNILIVSHPLICGAVLKIIRKKFLLKPTDEVINNYPKGMISQIFDKEFWVYKRI